MDINALYTLETHEKGAEMQITDQYGAKRDMFLTVMGCDSKTFRTAKLDHDRQMLDKDVNEQELKAKALSAATIGWRGFLDKGKESKFTQKKCEELYINAPYLIDQVNEFIAERANFTKA